MNLLRPPCTPLDSQLEGAGPWVPGDQNAGARAAKIELLESREVFSVDLLSGPLGGSVEQHATEESPLELHGELLLVQHGQNVPLVEAQAEPPLIYHNQRTADFWYDADLEHDFDQLFGGIEQTLASAHGLTGAAQARADYGFLGRGQTVAVIDSGIAWDHYALGGGYGANYRVVGGWDFTENDGNPYDDGTEGSHGTHVAGIIGAAAGASGDSGVAPGVDLVGLRVFDDYGAGYFSWVESALRWVHANRNAFENPITAVNLSLGTSWNSASVPSWAMLEDEFAQLEADGIFISVSAGNSFASYNATGLSYPAASSHVVPVMSVDDTGALSYFSQRHERAIAAPGRSIRSTVPDYAGNHNGVTDDWANFSGTSMAAPYVAGASVIVREAMEFVGRTGIDQWDIYDHLMATADSFFDAATNRTYKRLNLKNAIDALMPTDDFGSSVADAYNLGTLGSGSREIAGSITRLNDVDYFQFTAAATGKVTFTADSTHELVVGWMGTGAANGNECSIEVVAGQSYTVGLSSTGGLGHYTLHVNVEEQFSYMDLGMVAQVSWDDNCVGRENWYRVTASQSGFLTAEAFVTGNGAELAWFDINLQQWTIGKAQAEGQRADAFVSAGDVLFLRLIGADGSASLRLTNLLTVADSLVSVTGTDAADAFAFTAGAVHHTISVNGVDYKLNASDTKSFAFNGAGGVDAITLNGSDGSDVATLQTGKAQLRGDGYNVEATSFENVSIDGVGGYDTAYFYGSTGNDRFYADPAYARMIGDGFNHYARNFELSYTYADQGGTDTAYFYGSAGNDRFYADPTYTRIIGDGFNHYAQNFEVSYTYAEQGGTDTAYFYGSAGNDRFYADPTYNRIIGEGFNHYARNFEVTYTYAEQGGYDTAYFYGSTGNDRFYADPAYARMIGDGFNHYASNFELSYSYADQGGTDTAYFYGSAGDDRFYADPAYARIIGDGFNHYAQNFEISYAYAEQGGNDTAYFYGSAGNDRFYADPTYIRMIGDGFNHYARNFEVSYTYAEQGGNDTAYFYGSAGDDRYISDVAYSRMLGFGFNIYAQGFLQTYVDAKQGGNDIAYLCDIGRDDSVCGRDDYFTESRAASFRWASNFERVLAIAKSGEAPESDMSTIDYLFERVGTWV